MRRWIEGDRWYWLVWYRVSARGGSGRGSGRPSFAGGRSARQPDRRRQVPMADLAREQRYGRVEETFGEDTYLAGEMAYAYTKAIQSLNVSAMIKHFTASSEPEQGLNVGPVHGGERQLRTTWLPGFKKAIIYHCMHGYISIMLLID